jgi:NTP pyrophosphatase (non-canonical NTP hydrolase)
MIKREAELKEIIAHHGKPAQLIQAIQELAELQIELTNALHNKRNPEKIADEMADVLNMIEQLKIILANETTVSARQDFKIDRELERIKSSPKQSP